jgi:molybdopterin converting factor small subunit
VAKVNFYASAKAAVGTPELELSAVTLGELISNLSQINENMAKLLPTCSYLLNGQSCSLSDQVLTNTDNVDVLPQFAGG